VNDYLQTAAPHIFAAGDITGRMMLVQSGSYEGRLAAENAVLGPGQPHSHHIVPHGSFTDPEYAAVGLTEAEARAAHDIAVVTVPYTELDRAVIDGRTEGFCKLIVSQDTHRVLGAHLVGEQAVEASQMVAAGRAAGLWVEQWPVIMKNVIDACAAHGARLVFFDNTYMYPQTDEPQTEDTAFRPYGEKGRVRAAIAAELLEAMDRKRLTAMICRAPEFYGPGKTRSITNSAIIEPCSRARPRGSSSATIRCAA